MTEPAVQGPDEAISIDLLTDPAGVPRARAMLQRAQWAGSAFARYDRAAVDRIVHAAAAAGAAQAREYAEWAVRETGFGVAEHKVVKNLASSTGLVEAYAGHDYVTPRVDPAARMVEIPRPAGVVLALTPSTNPVATVFVKSLLALMTRNAVVVSPHPLARECSAAAARTLAEAAVAAGAPDGVIQVVDEPSVPLINALMADERTSVIVATGGTGVVRAAYSSGTPAIGVGPGNVPVFVADDADLPEAAQRIVDSKSFDNSILCTNESVLIVTEAAAGTLLRHLQRAGAYLLPPDERDKVRDLVFPGGQFDTRFVGKDATWIAAQAGLRVPGTTRVLLAPFPLVVPEEPLAHEKLCPVLGLTQVGSVRHGIDAARAVLRLGGRGHSAAIHAADPATIMAYGAALEVLRVVVNTGSSLGSAGVGTGLAPTMTIGTGFFGRSSVGENLQPKHLVQWTRLAYNEDPAVGFADFTGLVPWEAPAGAVPPYPVASNLRDADGRPRPGHSLPGQQRRERGPAPRPLGAGRLAHRACWRWRRPGSGGTAGGDQAGRAGGVARRFWGTGVGELRSFIFLDRLQPQTMCYLGSWVRGSLPRSNDAAIVVEVAPGLDVEPLTDVALKYANVKAGILVVERHFGYLEVHGSTDEVRAAGSAVLDALGASETDASAPQVLASKIVTMIDPQHAFLINRNKLGSMVLAGESLFVLEMQPASYAILAVNEAEKAARIKVVDYRMIGATGRVYLSGSEADVRQAADAAEDALLSRAGNRA